MNFNIHDKAVEFLNPVYGWLREWGFVIVIIVLVYIDIRLMKKAIQNGKAKKWSKIEYGNTNEWFSIEETKEKD